ncbi:MetS family NSS transporter small subunit [Shewanella pneumatophori]|uniref:MetS family NSS transporter small subunit n=1 Tax=Shewanella pneumatophori TaxID=314092 RepID=A0A9X1ZEG4_9GAMM|nr:MetS family NSS transporter small subunit [Shewanella pneumatophori]MCL1138367.1 MetS family NSS transporter small subunit [Shewanella pneumatophori]
MTTGAIIMMILALTITWGGAGVCIAIAMRAAKSK